MTSKDLVKENELNVEESFFEETDNFNTDKSDADEKTTEENFDEEILELVSKINEKIRYGDNIVIIFQSNQKKEPVVYMNGHPYDITAMTSGFVRDMKSKLISELEF